MKVTRIKIGKIKHRPLMENVELIFTEPEDDFISANCFVGMNGSGKSQFLETIAEIFLYLDRELRLHDINKKENPDFTFEIEYYLILNNKKVYVKICQPTFRNQDLNFEIFDTENKIYQSFLNVKHIWEKK